MVASARAGIDERTPMRIQRSTEHRIVPWANGLGVTADVFLSPPDTDDWTWRISIADVSDDLPFSSMPGIDRHIVVAQGAGMALTIDGAPEHRMDLRTPPLSFAGESVTACRLLDGPIADLNLMTRRGKATGTLRVVDIPSAAVINLWPSDIAIVVLDGTVFVDSDELTTFDAVLLVSVPAPDDVGRAANIQARIPTAGPRGARVAIASVEESRTICGTADLATARVSA